MERNQSLFATVVCVLCLAAFAVQTLTTLDTTAPTSDELPHLAAGFVSLTSPSRDLNAEHPPLIKMLAAAPLLGILQPETRDWARVNEWEYGREFLYKAGRDPLQLLNRARLVIVFLGLLLCLACFLWGWELLGPWGGTLAVFFCSLCPNIVAHSRLVTTDMGVTCFGFLSAYLAGRQARRRSYIGALLLGLASGAALCAKFSGIVLIAAIGTVLVYHEIRTYRKDPRGLRGTFVRAAIVLLGIYVVMGAVYWSILPFPEYLKGLRMVNANHNPGYSFYLLGEFKKGGFLFYFPAAFLLKASPATIFCAVLLAAWRFASRLAEKSERFLLAPPAASLCLVPSVVYAAFIMHGAADIGVRYLLPVYPFLFLGSAALLMRLSRRRAGPLLLVVVAGLHIASAWRAYPDPISYFNGLYGCSGQAAIRCLDDSNLDWGQDIGGAAKRVKALAGPGEKVRILYFGSASLDFYFDSWRPITHEEMRQPGEGLYVMSLHALNRWNAKYAKPHGRDWFKDFSPVAEVGNTYRIFDFRKKQ